MIEPAAALPVRGDFRLVKSAPPAAGAAAEESLAGADSVAWKINREIVLLLGWGAAILLQFAHPLVAAGVADHSLFMRNPRQRARRLRQTLRAMLWLTFGSADNVCRAARGINAIHDRVHGTLREAAGPFPAGTRYSAHDPALLRWVHATLLAVLPRAYELFVGRLLPGEIERYYMEASGMSLVLGAPDGYFPASRESLQRYMAHMLAEGPIVVTPAARRLANEVLHPPVLRVLPPVLWLIQLPAIGLLPPDVRAQYGLHWGRKEPAALRWLAAAVRLALRVSPPVVRFWPASRRIGGQRAVQQEWNLAAQRLRRQT